MLKPLLLILLLLIVLLPLLSSPVRSTPLNKGERQRAADYEGAEDARRKLKRQVAGRRQRWATRGFAVCSDGSFVRRRVAQTGGLGLRLSVLATLRLFYASNRGQPSLRTND